jgi:hypothetical protein
MEGYYLRKKNQQLWGNMLQMPYICNCILPSMKKYGVPNGFPTGSKHVVSASKLAISHSNDLIILPRILEKKDLLELARQLTALRIMN